MIRRFGLSILVGLLGTAAQAQQAPPKPVPVTDPALPTMGGPVLMVSDAERSVKFYTEGLGLVVRKGGNLFVISAAGSVPPPYILLQQAPKGPGAEPLQIGNGLKRIYFSSADTAALTARLKAAGYAPYVDPNEPYEGVIYVRDPDGYLIEITPGKGASGASAPPMKRIDRGRAPG